MDNKARITFFCNDANDDQDDLKHRMPVQCITRSNNGILFTGFFFRFFLKEKIKIQLKKFDFDFENYYNFTLFFYVGIDFFFFFFFKKKTGGRDTTIRAWNINKEKHPTHLVSFEVL